MSLRRLRVGELVALAGAVCIVGSLFLPWYDTASGQLSVWSTFGPAVAILLLAAALALALVAVTLGEHSSAIPMATVVWTTLAGLAAVIAAIIRVLERPDHATSPAVGAWLALAGAVAILAGSWQAMRDERTSAYEPPEVRPRVPPATTAGDRAGKL